MTYANFTQAKKIFFSLLIVCLFTALSSSISAFDNSAFAKADKATPTFGEMDATAAQNLINTKGKDLFIVDVRPADMFAKGNIPNSVNIPMATLDSSLGKIPTDKPILFVCRTGVSAKKAWVQLHIARPMQKDIWYFNGTPLYKADGSYELTLTK